MSAEIAVSKPVSPSKVVSPEAKSPSAAPPVAVDAHKSHAADNGGAMHATARPDVEGMRARLADLASSDAGRRTQAAATLGKMADAAAVPVLIGLLRDGDADVAREAATSLGLLFSAGAVEPLIVVVENREHYFHTVVRAAAAQSLGQLRDPRAVAPLLVAVRDPIAEVSAEAIGALSSLSDPRSLPALLEVVRNEHGFFLATARRAAVLGLARIGGEQAACELRFVAGNQWEDAGIRATAIEAIRKGSGATAGA
jgi:HEAT repeat protein